MGINKKGMSIPALNDEQKKFFQEVGKKQMVIMVGPAGVGKTYLAANQAMEFLEKELVDKIVLCRPAVSGCGERHGFLPGGLREKLEPWVLPLLDVIEERVGSKSKTELMIKNGTIELASFQYLRGRTFNRCAIILDEAQNTTPDQMRLFVTRVGKDSKMMILGDISGGQSDVVGLSGLVDIIDLVEHNPDLRGKVGVIWLNKVVRSELCHSLIEAYTNRQYKQTPEQLWSYQFSRIFPEVPTLNGSASGSLADNIYPR